MTMICKDAMAAAVANPRLELDSKPMNLIQLQQLCLANLYEKKERDTRQQRIKRMETFDIDFLTHFR